MNPLIQKYLRSEYAQGKRRTIFCLDAATA